MKHPRRRVHLGVAALATLAIAVAGCGSDDGGAASAGDAVAKAPAKAAAAVTTATAAAAPKSATKALSRKAYIREADKVCLLARGVSRRANEVVQKAFGSGSATKAAEAIESYMPAFMSHQNALKALPRPSGSDRKILDGLIKVMDGQIQALADESKALRQQDSNAMSQITQAQQQEIQFADDLGRQYGFKVCGRSS
ncbi:hypothetical protein [Baekduia sp. Peel2402]|uniref:hypothetical protein n=1 Tax=Baekduia sp. Peel2402 TaxID=3458296 RepID=UPI00403EB1AE